MRWEFNRRAVENADGLSMQELRALFEKEIDKNGKELFEIIKERRLTKLDEATFIKNMKDNFEITIGAI